MTPDSPSATPSDSSLDNSSAESQNEVPRGTKVGLEVSIGGLIFFTVVLLSWHIFRRRGHKGSLIEAKSELLVDNCPKELHGEHLRELEVPPAELRAGARNLSAELPGDEIRFISEGTR